MNEVKISEMRYPPSAWAELEVSTEANPKHRVRSPCAANAMVFSELLVPRRVGLLMGGCGSYVYPEVPGYLSSLVPLFETCDGFGNYLAVQNVLRAF